MKHILLFGILLLSFQSLSYAQSIESGIRLYEEGDYNRALRIFEDYDEPLAHLFSGKSYFGLGNFLKAKHHLGMIDSTYKEVYLEAGYTTALADFQLKNFAASLDRLYHIKENNQRISVTRAANIFYRQQLAYLTLNQRFKAFKASAYDEVRLDLVESAAGRIDYPSLKTLYTFYKTTAANVDTLELKQLEKVLRDSAGYWENYNPNFYPEAPDGISYNIGVALPEYDIDSPNFEISQNLYFGIQLAIEKFNSENINKKAFITFKNTSAEAGNAASVINQLVWHSGVDAIIGPLFSEVAVQFSKYAEQYQVPLLTPLANADNLNLDLSYTFQLNPTFGIQGKTIANYAIQSLGFDTLAIVVERGSLGEPSAIAFRDEARRLGAEIIRYYSEDLESQGYDISEFTEFLNPTTDTTTNYHIDAVYAPFTGQVAPTLINTLLTHLEAMQSDVTILGSEEWRSTDIASRNLPATQLYYTQSFSETADSSRIDEFESTFRLRFNVEPDFYAMIGFDAANVVLKTLQKVQNPEYLKEGLKALTNYQGLITEVSFNNTHINQEVSIKSYMRQNPAVEVE